MNISKNLSVLLGGLLFLFSAGLVFADTLTVQVNSTSDNGYDVSNSSTFTSSTPVLVGGKDVNGNLITAGFRFPNVTIPQGATIQSATIDWQNSWAGDYGSFVKTRIYAEAADNSVSFSSSSLPRNRVRTTSFSDYNSASQSIASGIWMSTTSLNQPPSIATVIQEVMNRPGWASGNALSLVVVDNGSTNDWWWEFKSLAAGATVAPKLTVTYTASGPTATPTPTNTPTPTPTPAPTYALSGTVFVDSNQNGVQDAGEAGYSGATVNTNGPASQTTTTDANGNYSFAALPSGVYQVVLTTPVGYTSTTVNPVNNLPLSADTTQNFGIAVAPTATPGPTNTPTPTSGPADSTSFSTTKQGFIDNISHGLIRTSTDKTYLFAGHAESSTALHAYWTSSAGLPNSSADFTGSATVNDSAAILTADAVYDGANIVHVLVPTNAGALKDYPFDLTTNTFKSAITIVASGDPTVSGAYLGTQGVSGMIDTQGTLHIAYWSASNHITYVQYTYNSSTNSLTLVEGPTQIDSAGSSNHPLLVVSPVDGQVTIAWVSQATSPAAILTRSRTGASTWGGIQTASTSDVWTSPNSGVNIDQGPVMVIDSANVKHLSYMQNYDATNDYGRMHEVTQAAGSTSWTDITTNFYSHAAGIAINTNNDLFIIGHGHPNNAGHVADSHCLNETDMCYIKKPAGGSWGDAQLMMVHSGSDSLDSSASVKWGVVGWNRPETVEVAFFTAVAGSYQNTQIDYGRIASATAPTSTPTPTPTVTPTPTPAPVYTVSGTVYVDANQNGVQDTGETGYSGATVQLSSSLSAVSDGVGNYTIANVPAGTYNETLQVPNGYSATTMNPVSLPVSADTTQNFGINVAPTNTPTPTPTITPTPTPTGPTTLTKQIAASTDDVNQDNATLDTTSSTLWVGTGQSTSSSYTGLRFTNITIPKGATIVSAHVELYVPQASWITRAFSMRADAVGNSVTFSTSSKPSQRTLTTASVAYSSSNQWNASTWVSLSEIKTVIQEVVNRADWTNGNSLSLIFKGTGGAYGRSFVTSYNGTPAQSPKLVISYQ